jgi:hypothetical protein
VAQVGVLGGVVGARCCVGGGSRSWGGSDGWGAEQP